jgi:hypothetical protein
VLVAEMTEEATRKKTSLSSATSTRARKAPIRLLPNSARSNVFAREEEGADGATQRALLELNIRLCW